MWLLVLLACCVACGDEVTTVGVRLSLDTESCPVLVGNAVTGPGDISLACDTPRVGQFVRTDTTVLAKECANVRPPSDAPVTLADIPSVLADFRSPTLEPGTTITVALEITMMPTSACEPSVDAAAISGVSEPVTLTDDVETITVPLRCMDALPCDPKITCGTVTVAAASASSSDIMYPPSNAFDGNPATRWSDSLGSWIQADLGTDRVVCGMSIRWHDGDSRVMGFRVETSTDGATYAPAYQGSSSGTTVGPEPVAFTRRIARYVRVTVLSNSFNNLAVIDEIEILGAAVPALAR